MSRGVLPNGRGASVARAAAPPGASHSTDPESPPPRVSRLAGDPPSTLPQRSPAQADLHPLLTLAEVADLLRVSEKTVRRLMTSRRFPCIRIGRQTRFLRGDVFRWLAARRET